MSAAELLKNCGEPLSLSLQFNGRFSRWTWVSRYPNVSILDLLELT